MLNQEAWMEEIMGLDVLDTHTHLVGDRLAARDFWEIAHYFWLNREMQAGGYPANALELTEEDRIAAFLPAYRATRNTLMNGVFTHIFRNLYGITISDEQSIRDADAAVRASAMRPQWAQEVADKLNIRAFVTNIPEHAKFNGMRRDAIVIPRIDGRLFEWTRTVHEAESPVQALDAVKQTIRQLISEFKTQGYPGIMTTLPGYDAQANRDYSVTEGATRDQMMMVLLHVICETLEQHGMFLQLFLGVERSWCGEAVPANDPQRILKLSGLFEKYAIAFELVVASEINNLDVVQAAWNFPNVHVGGMWWFNFRASTYRDSMQYRLEAIPAIKSSLIVSDARCIEWSYGKIYLVKKLIGEFLYKQIEAGWLDEETALQTAKGWLYESAARRYGFNG
ncbi:glucuronate isomerase [Paenibacillus doosanensis]|uniref:glucuronate isomerase n=1 Tax=Paenibacillus doosanensis TaxID=1229154 RepID=UPI00217F990B|nr:glucuronate isomerase [Paenibacillus doosanensis]MCS7464877.1 glucuronate isomerase [Paenibacillus doosanensis]